MHSEYENTISNEEKVGTTPFPTLPTKPTKEIVWRRTHRYVIVGQVIDVCLKRLVPLERGLGVGLELGCRGNNNLFKRIRAIAITVSTGGH
jgi:hypothetical protein